MTKPLTLLESILFFLGSPKLADGECFQCKTKNNLIDLGDGDVICQHCWDNWVPSYSE